ncbi:hypothetical protein [Aestuariibaculum marinum]|uniref:Uncharacterized protein n=1 Tax=Aestuariibaculum marinum TaxID=2683592 RepID=A0A8J6Q6U4_9FLAO|nr:hypothetical protein [Aestuariibaculum marinum]MBD0822666.1 hypothetical protein [Aestuariibaculum marinum]
MQYIEYLRSYVCGNKLPQFSDKELLNFIEILITEARIDEGFIVRGVSRYEERTKRQNELHEKLWELTKHTPAYRLLDEMKERSKKDLE